MYGINSGLFSRLGSKWWEASALITTSASVLEACDSNYAVFSEEVLVCPAKDKKQLPDDTKDYVKNYEDQKGCYPQMVH